MHSALRTYRWLLILAAAAALPAAIHTQQPKDELPKLKPGEIFKGRTGAARDELLKARGGNAESEAAVALGLAWLAKQQKADGHWQFDGTSKDEVAATAMALQPFLAAGESHKQGKKYQKTIANGIRWLTGKQTAAGNFNGAATMYSHAIATRTLCEAYGMTLDPVLKPKAQSAVKYIEKAQAGNGSWGYTSGMNGDTSILGWQIQALHVARAAGLPVSNDVFKKAGQFLDSVATDDGSKYGYTTKGGTPSLSAVALLSRQYMGWTPKNPSLTKGVEYLMTRQPSEATFETYYLYYASQVVHFFDGPEWHEKWNVKVRDLLLKKQETAKGDKEGSWEKCSGHIGESCGRLGTTCLCLLTLEVYYREPLLYKRDKDAK